MEDKYVVNVFPTDFYVENLEARNIDDKSFIGKFSGIYVYNTSDHYFKDVKIQPIDDDNRRGRSFIFNDTPIDII
ncbi:MAG: hypothetical protein ACPHY8_01460 [Patescibacteria group bacterium]